METITLRDYQLDIYKQVDRLLRHNDQVLVIGPTGCGKTTITQAIVGMATGTKHMTHAVILAPQVQIEDGFMPSPEGKQITIPQVSEDGVSILAPIQIHPARDGVRGGWMKLRNDDSDSRNGALDTYLKSTNPVYDCVLTTHSTFHRWSKGRNYSLKGRVLFVDEGHHAGETTELGVGIKKWLKNGGKIVFITATAFRTDRNGVFDDVTARVIRTMAEHARDGKYAPKDFRLSNYNLSMEAHDINEATGRSLPKDTAEAAEEMVAKWVEDGRPKTIVNVPSIGSVEWAYKLEAAFLKAGAKGVFNAVGLEKDKQVDLMELLRKERSIKHYDESKVDVIMSCKRFNEGTDWPLCSHVYNIGIPASLQLIIQRWGRAMRLKTWVAGYPDEHRNVASLTFFPLKLSQETWDSFSAYQRDQTFLLCGFLHDHESAQEFSTLRWRPGDVGRKRSGFELPNMTDLVADVQNAIRALSGADTSAEAILEGSRILLQYKKATGIVNPTDAEVLDYAKKIGRDTSTIQTIKDWLGVQAIKGMDTEDFQEVVNRLSRKLLREGAEYSPTPMNLMLITEELREIFDEVAEEHSSLVQVCAGTLEMVSQFTGRDAESVSNGLASRLRIRLSLEQAKDTCREYVKEMGVGCMRPTEKTDASKWCGLPEGSIMFLDVKRVIDRADGDDEDDVDGED